MGRVFGKRKREIMAEHSAIVAEYSARKRIVAEYSARKRIVAEYSAKYGRGFGKRKEIWLRFQQVQGVANLISKHERERKMKEIGVTWYV